MCVYGVCIWCVYTVCIQCVCIIQYGTYYIIHSAHNMYLALSVCCSPVQMYFICVSSGAQQVQEGPALQCQECCPVRSHQRHHTHWLVSECSWLTGEWVLLVSECSWLTGEWVLLVYLRGPQLVQWGVWLWIFPLIYSNCVQWNLSIKDIFGF